MNFRGEGMLKRQLGEVGGTAVKNGLEAIYRWRNNDSVTDIVKDLCVSYFLPMCSRLFCILIKHFTPLEAEMLSDMSQVAMDF